MKPAEGAQPWVPEGPADPVRLADAAGACRGCELWQDSGLVFGDGPPDARLVLVGEQPGDQEERAGKPFVGPAGRVLREALLEAEIDPDTVYLTNAVKHFRHRISGKRRIHQKPDVRHAVACHPWLEAEIGAVQPPLVVCLGTLAARAVLGRPARIAEVRGEVLEAMGRAALVTYHPSAVLRRRADDDRGEVVRKALISDLRLAAQVSELPGSGGTTT